VLAGRFLNAAWLGVNRAFLEGDLHLRLRNSARNLGLFSSTDLERRFDELRVKLETVQSELVGLRDDIERACQLNAARDCRLDAVSAELKEVARRARGLSTELRGDFYQRQDHATTTEYWTHHNVTAHRRFASVEDSLQQLEFRNQHYAGYIDLLPVTGKDGLTVLDYGCGPGHDLVGFAHYSRPRRLVGVEVSTSSLAEARQRLELHRAQAELVRIDYGNYDLPFEAASFDYIHCSGVLMCIEDPPRLLREIYRILKPGGEVRLMVYNHDSVWLHLYVAYIVQIENALYADLPTRVAFTRTTDGEDCPLNAVWRPEEMLALGEQAGFEPAFLGAAVSLWELYLLPKRHIACLHPALPRESRAFLMNLHLDQQDMPTHGDHRAGIDGCFRFRRPA
jgi:SAM-dependent methyltransferase